MNQKLFLPKKQEVFVVMTVTGTETKPVYIFQTMSIESLDKESFALKCLPFLKAITYLYIKTIFPPKETPKA